MLKLAKKDGKPGFQWSNGEIFTYDPEDEKSKKEAIKKAKDSGKVNLKDVRKIMMYPKKEDEE